MKNTIYKAFKNKNRQSGFTLLEILVALGLGVAILGAAIAMQVQHRKGFKLTNSKLEMQTNAKFAFEFISQSLRSAGSMGCKNSLALRGEAVNVDEGCLGGVCIAFNNPSIAYADFRPGFEVIGYEYTGGGYSPALSSDFTFVNSGLNNDNSDALTIAGGYGEVYSLTPGQSIGAIDTGFTLDMSNLTQVRLNQSQYGMLSSCLGAKIFKVTSGNAQIATGNIQWGSGGAADDNADAALGNKSEVLVGGEALAREFRRAAVTTYFVGDDPVNGVPTLYQDVDGISSRLIDGVEEMHLQFGLSENPGIRNVADRYVTADVIGSPASANNLWESVVSVRVGLIMRSAQPAYEAAQTQNISLGCVGYNQATQVDRFARSSYCTEVSLRNRLVGVRTGSRE